MLSFSTPHTTYIYCLASLTFTLLGRFSSIFCVSQQDISGIPNHPSADSTATLWQVEHALPNPSTGTFISTVGYSKDTPSTLQTVEVGTVVCYNTLFPNFLLEGIKCLTGSRVCWAFSKFKSVQHRGEKPSNNVWLPEDFYHCLSFYMS